MGNKLISAGSIAYPGRSAAQLSRLQCDGLMTKKCRLWKTLAKIRLLRGAQNDRGGKLAIESKPELFGSATGDPGASCREHCPFAEVTPIIAIDDGAPNSAT